MKLTEENLDYQDAMPPRENNSIKWETPGYLQELIDKRKAEMEKARSGRRCRKAGNGNER